MALSGINHCHQALVKLLPGTDDGACDTGGDEAEVIGMAATAGVVAIASSLAFGVAAMKTVHDGADEVIATICADKAANAIVSQFAVLVSEEAGVALPWFDMCVARFNVRTESIMNCVQVLLETMDELLLVIEDPNLRSLRIESAATTNAQAFVQVVSAHVARMGRQGDDAIRLLVGIESDVREIRAAIVTAKGRAAAAAAAGDGDGDGAAADGSARLNSPLLVFAECSRNARIVANILRGLSGKIAELSAELGEYSMDLMPR